jgi:hypothetical protein
MPAVTPWILRPMILRCDPAIPKRKTRHLEYSQTAQEALVGGPDFIFYQCVVEMVLRDETLHFSYALEAADKFHILECETTFRTTPKTVDPAFIALRRNSKRV